MGESGGTELHGEKLFLAALEQSYAHDFPNPDRVGCDDPHRIRNFVFGQADADRDRALLDHLTHCSPCFQEFLRYRTERRRQTRQRRIASIAALLVLACSLVGYQLSRPHQAEPDIHTQTPRTQPATTKLALDLRDRSSLRGEVGPIGAPAPPPLQLVRGRLETIYLPVGSDDGPYELELRKAEDEPALAKWSGQAKIQDGLTVLSTNADTGGLTPGQYVLAIRKPGRSWRAYPVIVQ